MSELFDLAEQFKLLQLEISLQVQKEGELPAFKGSMLHGWLGQQLHKQNEKLYFLLFNEHDVQQPKPYAIACSDYRTSFLAGSIVTFRLSLFGVAVEIAEKLVDELVSNPLLLGPARLPVKLQTIASNTPSGARLGIHPLPLVLWLTTEKPLLTHAVSMQMLSPLRIKHQGRFLQNEVPSLSLMMNNIQRRLLLLTQFWLSDDAKWEHFLRQRVVLGEHRLLNQLVHYEDWQRYSLSRQKFLPFGGLMGEFSYEGDIYPAINWLQIGELLQIGGKTTFGLGEYRLAYL